MYMYILSQYQTCILCLTICHISSSHRSMIDYHLPKHIQCYSYSKKYQVCSHTGDHSHHFENCIHWYLKQKWEHHSNEWPSVRAKKHNMKRMHFVWVQIHVPVYIHMRTSWYTSYLHVYMYQLMSNTCMYCTCTCIYTLYRTCTCTSFIVVFQ